ncbi:MAG: GGDEF domain-containing protein [Lachnospiraceae bacterium]|nr:GGDEF domain-containing protein [Lachnospiraceae bacterium]
MAKEKKRWTIGFLVSGITDSFTEYMCRGVMRAARDADVNLVVLPGKYINRDLSDDREIRYEYQNNTIFSYARKDNLDALVIAADCIGCLTTRDNVQQFLKEYDDIPNVLLASKVDGYVSVNYDNENGIREGLEYLIEELHCQRIGMIGGPEDNTDARERKDVYLRVMEEYQLPFEERYFVEGNLAKDESNTAGRIMLERNPDIEAVFCVNDDSALALYREMEQRGLVPGKDIKIFGYDDTLYAAKAKPSLSSVSADPSLLGQRALEMAIEHLEGREITSEVLKTRLIKRNSLRSSFEGSEKNYKRLLNPAYIDDYFDSIFYRYQRKDVGEGIEVIRSIFHNMMEKIIAFFRGGKADSSLYDETMKVFEQFLNKNALEYADIDNLLTYFVQLFQAMKTFQENVENRYESGRMLSDIYRHIVSAMDYQFSQVEEVVTSNRYSMKQFIRNTMQFDRGNDQSYSILLNDLDWLGIRNACIYTFEEPIIHLYKEQFQLPEKMYLKAVLEDGQPQSIPTVQQAIPVKRIFHHAHLPKARRSMVTLPLYFNEMLYGMILCDMTEMLFENGDFLNDHLSSAVKIIATLRTNERIQQQLEESLVTLKENNIELDNLSKSDALTGIRNRRGFYDAAQKMVEKNKVEGRDTLVAYVDMNNLKIINDRYGHEEGDFSLKLIGDVLVEAMGESGIVGRIGGDEFACVRTFDSLQKKSEVVKDIAVRFTNYNIASEKPYNVTVSTGAYILEGTSEMDLEEALSLADEELYIAKQSRLKIVAKEEFLIPVLCS